MKGLAYCGPQRCMQIHGTSGFVDPATFLDMGGTCEGVQPLALRLPHRRWGHQDSNLESRRSQ